MKKILIFALVISSLAIFAQAPEAFNYQFVARDSTGQMLTDFDLVIKISLLENNSNGIAKYIELHETQTNRYGLVDLKIGVGLLISGNFSEIEWGDDTYYIKTEIDTEGNGDFIFLGTSQLLSIPYALHSKTAAMKEITVLSQAEIDLLTATAGTVVLNSTTDCLNYYTGLVWMEMCGNCSPQPSQSIAGESQTIIGDQATLNANTPQSGTGNWEIISGIGGVVADPLNPNSLFTGIQPNDYILSWTITTVCGSSSDEVQIHFINEPLPPSDDLVFAPYVDCLLWPNFDITDVSGTGICNYTCAFIVDNEWETGANACWGGYPTLGMDYYQDKITSLRSHGGEIIMSFGGATGVMLAYAAADEFELRDAIKIVIDAYNLSRIDFDIEGFFIAEQQSIARRSKAMRLLQNEYPEL